MNPMRQSGAAFLTTGNKLRGEEIELKERYASAKAGPVNSLANQGDYSMSSKAKN